MESESGHRSRELPHQDTPSTAGSNLQQSNPTRRAGDGTDRPTRKAGTRPQQWGQDRIVCRQGTRPPSSGPWASIPSRPVIRASVVLPRPTPGIHGDVMVYVLYPVMRRVLSHRGCCCCRTHTPCTLHSDDDGGGARSRGTARRIQGLEPPATTAWFQCPCQRIHHGSPKVPKVSINTNNMSPRQC